MWSLVAPFVPPFGSLQIIPYVPEELKQSIIAAFVDMRAKDKARAAATGNRSTLTARQLLSILRLAQAYARLEMSPSVQQTHVDEAIRLISVSKASVMESDSGDRPVDADYISRIWALLRDKALSERKGFGESQGRRSQGRVCLACYPCALPCPVSVVDALAIIQAQGFSEAQLNDVLGEYRALGLLTLNASMTRIEFVAEVDEGGGHVTGFEDL